MRCVPFFLRCLAILLLTVCISCKKDGSYINPDESPGGGDTITNEINLDVLKFTAEEATDWTQLFIRNAGWLGGDGIFSIPLSGVDTIGAKQGNTLLLFSDTQIGEIVNGALTPGWLLINNSTALIKGNEPIAENIQFSWDTGANNKPASVFIPNSPLSQTGDYFWLGDGFVNQERQNETNILGYKIKRINTGFGFAVGGSSVITIQAGSNAPYKNAMQEDAPLFVAGTAIDNGYAFGAGIFVNTKWAGAPAPDGYVYIYGVKNLPQPLSKGLMAARVLPSYFKDFSKWRFWDSTGWNLDINNIQNAAVITDRVSDELSLSPLPDGRYALVFQTDVWGGIGLRLGKTPYGPFGPVIPVWDCKEALTGKNYFAYNAKAHPNLSKPGELLISFNVNSFDFFHDIIYDPNLYRPRFIKIKFL